MNKGPAEKTGCGQKAAVIFIVTDPEKSGAREAAEALEAAGTCTSVFNAACNPDHVLTADCPDLQDRKDVLYVTDDPRMLDRLLDGGCCAAGLMHDGNRDADLSRADYLLEDAAWVDADSYQKIYERLKGLPWTILETERCIVRELVPEDAPAVLSLYDAEALRFVEGPCKTAEEEAKVLAAYAKKVYGFFGYGTWALIDRASGRLIGRMGFEPFERENGAMSFGYILHPQFRGKGYALEAGTAILRYGRQMLGFTVIEADTLPENAASARLLERLGFVLAGTGSVYTYRSE